jgi:hypothetical protein
LCTASTKYCNGIQSVPEIKLWNKAWDEIKERKRKRKKEREAVVI